MTLLLRVVGVVLVLLVFLDLFRTVLLPTSHGTVDRLLSGALWAAARRSPRRWRPAARRASGPLSLVLTPAVWYAVLLVAFALVYLPGVRELAYAQGVPFGDRGLVEALYLSGTALTTLGFGDITGATSEVRAVTVVEAASGLGVLTATLGYLPSIYVLVSELRAANQSVADLGADDPQAAADLLGVDAVATLEGVRRDVLAARQHLQRFPVLHTFHPDPDESVVALARGAAGLWVAGHFVADRERPVERHVRALGTALERLVDELSHHVGGEQTSVDADEVFSRGREVSPHPETAEGAQVDGADLELLRRLRAVVDAYARSHDYPVEA